MNRGNATVLASDGANTLGGKDWDQLIQEYLYNEFFVKNKSEIPDEMGFLVQKIALEAKLSLSDNQETNVTINLGAGDLNVTLYRTNPNIKSEMDHYIMDDNGKFYFEEVSLDLMSKCRRICNLVIEKAGINNEKIDEVIMTGGSCRMPMVRKMLEDLFRKKVKNDIKGFSYDTAVAIGAAIYGQSKGKVNEIVSHSIGIKYMEDNRYFIDHFISKNTKLPAREEREYDADENAVLSVYEGESVRPDECVLRGRIELDNPEGKVKIILAVDTNGIVTATADYPPHGSKVITIKNEGYMFDERLEPLRKKIQEVKINL